MKTCYDKHPTWKHMVWTEENMPVPFYFHDEWNLDNNHARRSDLVRLQVLINHGGVYLDTDMECIKPIDDLLTGYRFVIGTECGKPSDKNCNIKHLNNAIMASTKNSIIVGNIITEVKRRYKKLESDLWITGGIKHLHPLDYVSKLAGPTILNHFGRKFSKLDGVKIYPAEYFYPLHYSNRKKMKDWDIPTNPKTLQKNTHMIHHYAGSWYKQQ